MSSANPNITHPDDCGRRGVSHTSSDGEFRCELATFNGTELTAISGIPQALQRAWRSRGQLPGGSGRGAAFTALDVAEVHVRYQLSLNGVSPSESGAIGREAAGSVLLFGLLSFDGACEVRGDTQAVRRFLEAFAADERLATKIVGQPLVGGYLWRGDGGQLEIATDVVRRIEEKRFVSNFFLDLEVTASQMIERAGRPLFMIEVHGTTSDKRTRRLSRPPRQN